MKKLKKEAVFGYVQILEELVYIRVVKELPAGFYC